MTNIKNNIIALGTAALLLSSCGSVSEPEPLAPLPSDSQVDWQKDELCAFIHFGTNTFCDKEWGYGDAPAAVFNPVKLDCRQWAKTLAQAGFKCIIITAKHHDGFCLWPTQYTDYSVAASPYKDGKGDIVGELAEACREEGLKMGVYLSPWDRHQSSYGTEEYVKYYHNQMRELLTSYGDIAEVWLDGANGGDGYYGGACEARTIDRQTYYDLPGIYAIVEECQPSALIFSDGGPGCRWVGNEDGIAGMTNWSMLRGKEVYPGCPIANELPYGHEDGYDWIPAECDVSIRPGWFYHESQDGQVKSPEYLMELYCKSVGRNGKLLLNFPVDKDGLIHPVDSANVQAFHKLLVDNFTDNLLADAKVTVSEKRDRKHGAACITDEDYDSFWSLPDGQTTGSVIFDLGSEKEVSKFFAQEKIALGQRVQKFSLEYLEGDFWKPVETVEEMTTIGYKRIICFKPVNTKALRFTVLASRACPCINNMEAFK